MKDIAMVNIGKALAYDFFKDLVKLAQVGKI